MACDEWALATVPFEKWKVLNEFSLVQYGGSCPGGISGFRPDVTTWTEKHGHSVTCHAPAGDTTHAFSQGARTVPTQSPFISKC